MGFSVALATAREALALDEDMPPLVAAFRELGAVVTTPSWDDPDADWSSCDAVVLRSTWDYIDRIDAFLAWADHCARLTRFVNPPDLLRWNTDKHYLLDLARAGVPVVATRFAEPGEAPAVALADFLAGGLSCGHARDFREFVIKPAIGVGSRDAARYRREDTGLALPHLSRLLGAGRAAMLQPYLERVDEAGETAMVYLDGVFSHAARKGALLVRGAAFVSGLFAPEAIAARQPGQDEEEVAAAAVAAIGAVPPLYARVDLIRDADGAPVVLELELTEPSLFFGCAPGSATRFAAAVLARCGAARPVSA